MRTIANPLGNYFQGRSTSMGEKNPEKISSYKVVRYVTLKSQ